MLEEGGNAFFKGQRYLEGEEGVKFRTIGAMTSAAQAREFTGPEYAQCPAFKDNETGAGCGTGYMNATP